MVDKMGIENYFPKLACPLTQKRVAFEGSPANQRANTVRSRVQYQVKSFLQGVVVALVRRATTKSSENLMSCFGYVALA